MDGPELTPAQQRAFAELLSPGDRPSFPQELADELRATLDRELADVARRLGPAEVWVTKHTLMRVHQCEQHYVAEAATSFVWTLPVVRGVVAHRSVQLAMHLPPDLPPGEVVTLVIERMTEPDETSGVRDFLLSASAAELAELRSDATSWLTSFQECFPPLRPSWRPRVETSLQAEIAGGRVVLRARPDLALGRPVGYQARVLLIDFKTGSAYPSHADDLRYYALVEALRQGVPPWRVATYYLDSARWHAEDVTAETLRAAARRVVAGVRKMADLSHGLRTPVLTPGPGCAYCPLRESCPGAAEWEERSDRAGIDSFG